MNNRLRTAIIGLALLLTVTAGGTATTDAMVDLQLPRSQEGDASVDRVGAVGAVGRFLDRLPQAALSTRSGRQRRRPPGPGLRTPSGIR